MVRTKGVSEAIAALVAYDPQAPLDAVAEALTAGVDAVEAGEITRAVRDSSCEVGPIAEGDWLGISRAGIHAVEPTVDAAATELLAHLLTDEHEICTIIEGEGSSVADTRRIVAWMGEEHPDVVVEVHSGGQPLYPYFVGVE